MKIVILSLTLVTLSTGCKLGFADCKNETLTIEQREDRVRAWSLPPPNPWFIYETTKTDY